MKQKEQTRGWPLNNKTISEGDLPLSDGESIVAHVPIQIAPVLELGGGIRRFKTNNATMYRAFILNTDETTTARSQADLFEACSDAFTAGKAAYIAMIKTDGTRETEVLWRGFQDGEPVPVAEALTNRKDRFRKIMQSGSLIDVIPLETMMIDPETAQSIDKGKKTSIDLNDFATGGLGGQIEQALRSQSSRNREKVGKSLEASLDKNGRNAFAIYGWTGIWTSDLNRYLQDLDIEPPKVPIFGYALASAVIRQVKSEGGSENRMLTRAITHSPAVSREFIPTVSDPAAHDRHEALFRNLVERIRIRIDPPGKGKDHAGHDTAAGITP